jgi:1-deoxy-D-xylulose-5-phosphate reductoisomerase
MKKIFLLGSTGSIGTSTLSVVRQHPDKFSVPVLVVNSRIDELARQVEEFKPQCVVVYDEAACRQFRAKYQFDGLRVLQGAEGVKQAMRDTDCDVFLNAFVGFAGLQPTVDAIRAGKDIAIANKETLVVAGELINRLTAEYQIPLLPIDSEHSAIWQCLVGEKKEQVKKIILTASGGPFRGRDRNYLGNVTPEQALKHPNWDMGAKITIDSATLMNKGLEVIEAFWLYQVNLDQIEVIVHPQSIIHSMVVFQDNSIKAQLGVPDMRIPIQYALSYPDHFDLDVPETDFARLAQLTFEKPDLGTFRCLQLAFDALESGGTAPAILNAANEIAVDAFLKKQIGFLQIAGLIEETLNRIPVGTASTLEEYMEIDALARKNAMELIKSKQNGQRYRFPV